MSSLPKTYKAVVIKKAGQIGVENVDLKQPGPGEILVKILACGVCHSDKDVLDGNFGELFPRVPGHEIIGDVIAVGKDVQRFKGGERVGGPWHGGHDNECRSCTRGFYQMCENGAVNGVSRDGGYAEYVLLRSEAVVRVPKEADPAEVAPLLCAGVTVFNSMRHMNVPQGSVVAVLGLGGLGHLAVQFANKMGYTVVAVSRGTDKKDFAMKLGAHHYIDSSDLEKAPKKLMELGGADLIISTAPNTKAVQPFTAGLAILGKLLVLSPMGDLPVATLDMISKGASVCGWPSGQQQDSEDTIAFATQHGVKCMIEKFPFEKYQDALDVMESGKVRFRAVLTM